ncbi:hypothetical protein [Bartonella sp. TS25HLJMH]|uniref:hypothetical protein n=1 Tax=Bartonella sp. TS25HLJMH TaxID=3243576 RepID=UPI0035D09278
MFTFNQPFYIASANYGGYLVGSMFFTFGRIGNISLAPHMPILCSYSNECTYYFHGVNTWSF